MSRRTSIRIKCNLIGTKALDVIHEGRLMCLMRYCGTSNVELFNLLIMILVLIK